MGLSKIFFIAVSLAACLYLGAATKGCPPVNTDIYCFWFNEQCNDNDKLCPNGSICCGDNCGTFCVDQTEAPEVECPPIDKTIKCVWYNEQCNADDKLCPDNSICCKDSCGTKCVTADGTTTQGV